MNKLKELHKLMTVDVISFDMEVSINNYGLLVMAVIAIATLILTLS